MFILTLKVNILFRGKKIKNVGLKKIFEKKFKV